MNDRDEVVVDLERVKRYALAVEFETLLERAEFLTACEAASIQSPRWPSAYHQRE